MGLETALIVSAVAATAASGASMLSKPKVPKPTPQPTPNAAAEDALKRDQLARRRGPAANLLLGALGAESSAGKKTSLGA